MNETEIISSLESKIVKSDPGSGLAVNFCQKSGEMRSKEITFTAYFLHLFAVNAVNRRELFFSPCSR